MSYGKLEVGKLFQEGKTRYQEGVRFDINDGGMDLIICYGSPTSKEKEAIKKESMKYGYLVQNNVILMFFKFGREDWMDSSFSVHSAIHLSELPEIRDEEGFGLHVYLIDANTGILKAMRLIGLDTTFSRMLKNDIIKQKELPVDGFDRNLNNLYRYQTDELVKNAKIIIE